MENIYNVLYNYSKDNKVLDTTAINNIINSYVSEYNLLNLNEKKKKILFITNHNLLDYYIFNKTDTYLIKYNNKLLSNNYKTDFKIEDNLNELEESLRKNIYLLQVIMYELEYAHQIMNNNNELEKDLIASEKEFLYQIKDKYNSGSLIDTMKYHDKKKIYENNISLSFIERMSKIYSIEKIIDLLNNDENNVYNLILLEKNVLLDEKLKTYSFVNDAPTLRFFKNLGINIKISKDDIKSLSNEQKLKYGFNIDTKEYINNMNTLSINKKRILKN